MPLNIDAEMHAEYRADAAIRDWSPEDLAYHDLCASAEALAALSKFYDIAQSIADQYGVSLNEFEAEAIECLQHQWWLGRRAAQRAEADTRAAVGA
jgi:hypothetical protein